MRTRSRREPRIALAGRVDAAAVERCGARVAGPPHARQTIALCAVDGVELRPGMARRPVST